MESTNNTTPNFYARLLKVQNELKAAKNAYNSFGKYFYRNAEAIIEAAKPVLAENSLLLHISDEVQLIGNRFYIKATVTIFDALSDMHLSASAYAREADAKKGMDEAQITGAATSYAVKYALGHLLAIDDNKDDDALNNGSKPQVTKVEPEEPTQDLINEVTEVSRSGLEAYREWFKSKPNNIRQILTASGLHQKAKNNEL